MKLAVLPQRDELIERCLKGHRLSYRELYERYSKAMYNTCLRMQNNVAEAEEQGQYQFGNVILGEPAPGDMKEKNKLQTKTS